MTFYRCGGLLATALLLLGFGVPLGSHAAAAPTQASPAFAPDTARITNAVDNTKLTTVQGSHSLKALNAVDQGAVADIKPIRNMTLLLKRSAQKQSRFDAYVNELNSPGSSKYHQWLTAKQIGSMFGPAQSDIDKVTRWLRSQGLTVNEVLPAGTMIRFSGTSAEVRAAFHTQLHTFTSHGESHFANVGDQQIPEALASVVQGVASLDNFFPKPQHHDVGTVTKDKHTGQWKTVSTSPDFTVPPGTQDPSVSYDVVPADFNKIYNVEPLWGQATPIRGAGQTVAVLERTDVQPQDVATFRTTFLPADAKGVVNYVNPTGTLSSAGSIDPTCTDPGRNGDEGEAALDAEWIGAAAPDANIVFASCDDSNSPQFGPFTAAMNLLDNPNVPPPSVFSLSYGECEIISRNDIVNDVGLLWEQAAAEGVTVYVSSGDAGSAGCDQNSSTASFGINVNAMSSTPWNVSVGGTDFDDLGKTANYWTSTNLPGGLSAVSYIPEQTWNDSCASSKLDAVLNFKNGVKACNTTAGQQFMNTAGGSGGPSAFWIQPPWQADIYGAPTSHVRMQPDISLFSANGIYGHALLFCMSDASVGGTACDYSNPDNVLFNSAGGTSFAAPAMAGVQALINQATQASHGNVAPALYAIATKEYGTNASPNKAMLNACNSSNGTSIDSDCVFNDVTQGDIDVPCFAGGADCYSGAPGNSFGVISQGGDIALAPAWKTNAGYDYATGLGSANVTNLVNAMIKYDQTSRALGYGAPGDFLNPFSVGADNYSDIALVDPVAGIFTDMAMKGSVMLRTGTQPVDPGFTIGANAGLFVHLSGVTTTQSAIGFSYASLAWTGPDHQLHVWLSDGSGGPDQYLPYVLGDPYAASWTLVGPGDFNGPDQCGDRQADLLWHNESTGEISWWDLSLGLLFGRNGPIRHVNAHVGPVLAAPAGSVPTIADVDGDGYADIVWTRPDDNSVTVWINNHAGNFVSHQVADHKPGFVLYGAGDVNGDGKTDLIWTDAAGNKMSWWIMNGFTVVDQQVLKVKAGYTMSSIADYDGDGLADILWVDNAGGAFEWQGTGSGFQSFRVTDATGKPVVISAGMKVQPTRLQGTSASGGAAIIESLNQSEACKSPSD
ncbi:protease pro-enzyme activation domain-containing protein [Pinirhizobacter sp.]|uniref:protease pro-enzyme activation domain-containing protein n=1 Tax=Pinirhizobacter sp. TaxID=2950432 RepID=UPI002F3FDE1B